MDVRDVPEKVSQQDDAKDPNKGPDDVVGEEFPVVHRTHSGHERSEGANQRNEPGEHDRFCSVPFVEGVRLLQMFLVENAAPRIAEELLSYFVPNPIVGGMAENPRDREQDKNGQQVQRAVQSR